jgi:phosphoribosylformylglycinamidine synthase PurS subunit
MKAQVIVKLRESVLDPQGMAISRSIKSMGLEQVQSVRQGKLFEVELNAKDQVEAEKVLKEISEKLLANTVIEDFSFKIL